MLLAWYYPTRFAQSRIFDYPCSRRETKGRVANLLRDLSENFYQFLNNFPNWHVTREEKEKKKGRKRGIWTLEFTKKKQKSFLAWYLTSTAYFTDKETRADLVYHKWSRIALALIVPSRFRSRLDGCIYIVNGKMTIDFQLDEYHDRLEDFPEEDEDVNSDDDNNSAPPITKIVPNKLQGKPFKMEVMDF